MHRPNIAQSTSLEVTKKRGFESNPPRSDPRRSEAQTQRRTPAIQTSRPRRCQNNRLAATSPTCERLGRPHLALYNSARRPALLSSPRLRLVLLHPPALPLSSFPRTKRTRLPHPQARGAQLFTLVGGTGFFPSGLNSPSRRSPSRQNGLKFPLRRSPRQPRRQRARHPARLCVSRSSRCTEGQLCPAGQHHLHPRRVLPLPPTNEQGGSLRQLARRAPLSPSASPVQATLVLGGRDRRDRRRRARGCPPYHLRRSKTGSTPLALEWLVYRVLWLERLGQQRPDRV